MIEYDCVSQEYFMQVVNKIIKCGRYEQMRNYISHSDFTVYEHCIAVAEMSYGYALKYKIKCNLEDLITAALLHDYYLYDWHEKSTWHKWHGFKHHKFAAENAVKDYGVNGKVEKAIFTHMFPLTFWTIPTSKEGWIISFIDKCVAARETLKKYKS